MPWVSDSPLNRGVLYRFFAIPNRLKDHRWYCTDAKYVGHAYTSTTKYNTSDLNSFLPRPVNGFAGAMDSAASFGNTNWRINDHATVNHGVGTGDFAIMAVVNPDSASGAYRPIWHNGAAAPGFYHTISTGELGLFWSSNRSSGTSLTVGVWQHVIATRLAGTISFYIDGLVQPTTHALGTSMADAAQGIGLNSTSPTVYVGGDLSEVSFFTRGIDATEAMEHYTDWRRGYERSLNWAPLITRRSAEAVAPTGTSLLPLLGVG